MRFSLLSVASVTIVVFYTLSAMMPPSGSGLHSVKYQLLMLQCTVTGVFDVGEITNLSNDECWLTFCFFITFTFLF